LGESGVKQAKGQYTKSIFTLECVSCWIEISSSEKYFLVSLLFVKSGTPNTLGMSTYSFRRLTMVASTKKYVPLQVSPVIRYASSVKQRGGVKASIVGRLSIVGQEIFELPFAKKGAK
jgi:hypothetical protein